MGDTKRGYMPGNGGVVEGDGLDILELKDKVDGE
mgnify:FL=1